MRDLASIMYDNSDAGLAARRDAQDRQLIEDVARNARAACLHDDVLDCIYALEVETSPRHGMATREKAVAALHQLYNIATKVEK